MDTKNFIAEKLDRDELIRLIEYHNRRYWDEGEPEIPDARYDELIRALQKLEPDHELVTRVYAPAVAGSGQGAASPADVVAGQGLFARRSAGVGEEVRPQRGRGAAGRAEIRRHFRQLRRARSLHARRRRTRRKRHRQTAAGRAGNRRAHRQSGPAGARRTGDPRRRFQDPLFAYPQEGRRRLQELPQRRRPGSWDSRRSPKWSFRGRRSRWWITICFRSG